MVLMLLFAAFYPTLLGPYLFYNFEKLQTPRFKATIGTLTEQLSHRKLAAFFHSFFMYRRLLLALAIVQLRENQSLQLILQFANNLLYCVFLLTAKPFESRSENITEILSELTTGLIVILAVGFTDWATDPNTRQLTGDWAIGFTMVLLVGNLAVLVVKVTIRCVKQVWRKVLLKRAIKAAAIRRKYKLHHVLKVEMVP